MDSNTSPYLILWLRSLAFWVVFPISLVLFAILLMLAAPFSLKTRWALLQIWVQFILWWLRVSCNLTHEIQGAENIPADAGIVFSKHQSTWETIALQQIFPLQVWVAKRELMWIPFFGWGLWLMQCIHIKRGSGKAAIKQLVTQGKARMEEGIWVVIFPEGTRIAAGSAGALSHWWCSSGGTERTRYCTRSRTMAVNTGHGAVLSNAPGSSRFASEPRSRPRVKPRSSCWMKHQAGLRPAWPRSRPCSSGLATPLNILGIVYN